MLGSDLRLRGGVGADCHECSAPAAPSRRPRPCLRPPPLIGCPLSPRARVGSAHSPAAITARRPAAPSPLAGRAEWFFPLRPPRPVRTPRSILGDGWRAVRWLAGRRRRGGAARRWPGCSLLGNGGSGRAAACLGGRPDGTGRRRRCYRPAQPRRAAMVRASGAASPLPAPPLRPWRCCPIPSPGAAPRRLLRRPHPHGRSPGWVGPVRPWGRAWGGVARAEEGAAGPGAGGLCGARARPAAPLSGCFPVPGPGTRGGGYRGDASLCTVDVAAWCSCKRSGGSNAAAMGAQTAVAGVPEPQIVTWHFLRKPGLLVRVY